MSLPSPAAATGSEPTVSPTGAPGGGLTPRRELFLLVTLAGIQFTHILDFMIMMPLGPQFLELFQISSAQFGVLVSAYTFAAGASGLAASTYIDRIDRKTLLLVLYTGFTLATLACGLAPGYNSLLVARVAAGVFGGVLAALSQTIVGDLIPFERRGRAMGVVMSAFSVSTVAGIPLGLWVANHFSWHMPFFMIAALSAVLVVFAGITLPKMRGHLQGNGPRLSTRGRITQALGHRNHLRALLLSACMTFAGFTVIPFITIYMQKNAGVPADMIPVIYLVGGAATLLSARLVGRLADRHGKIETFSGLALLFALPVISLSLITSSWPFWAILVVTTLFFTIVSGRMIPGMAILTSATVPQIRGTFMTLNSAVQSASMGLASLLAGVIITQAPSGQLEHMGWSALLGTTASLCSIVVARRLVLHGATA